MTVLNLKQRDIDYTLDTFEFVEREDGKFDVVAKGEVVGQVWEVEHSHYNDQWKHSKQQFPRRTFWGRDEAAKLLYLTPNTFEFVDMLGNKVFRIVTDNPAENIFYYNTDHQNVAVLTKEVAIKNGQVGGPEFLTNPVGTKFVVYGDMSQEKEEYYTSGLLVNILTPDYFELVD